MDDEKNERRLTLREKLDGLAAYVIMTSVLTISLLAYSHHNSQVNSKLCKEIDRRYIFKLRDFVTGCPLEPEQQSIINIKTGKSISYNSRNLKRVANSVQKETGLEFKQWFAPLYVEKLVYTGDNWPDNRWSWQHRELFEED